MDYLEAASLLGRTILESDIYVEFKKAEDILLNDTKAQELLLSYREMQQDMVKAARDEMGKDDLENVRTKLLEKQTELNEYEITKRYFDGKKAFEQMMQEVNSVLEHYLSGGNSDCTGSCDTCGGCE